MHDVEQIVVFDLDDTLYKEIDYLTSAYRVIAREVRLDVADEMLEWYRRGENAFRKLIDKYQLTVDIAELLDIYRYHRPNISLTDDAYALLSYLRTNKIRVGIITDGRSRTQRNKLQALGLEWIEDVVISEELASEKPSEANYRYFMDKYPGGDFTYIGDNPKKDFIAPNRLGWNTVGVRDDGRNIHQQKTTDDRIYQPALWVNSLTELM